MAGNSQQQRRRGPGRPFQPGQSGNPSGRPKEVGHVRDLARQHTEAAIMTLAEIMTNPEEKGAARVAAAEALLDRAWGKAPASMEITGEGGGPVGLVVHLHMPEAMRGGDLHD